MYKAGRPTVNEDGTLPDDTLKRASFRFWSSRGISPTKRLTFYTVLALGFHRKCNSMEMLHDNLGFVEQFDDFVGLEFIAPFLEDNAPPLEGLFDDILLMGYEDIEATNLPVWDIKGFNNEEDA
ncbi:hypothetical protein L1887_22400 [Cichorium endivia]|nr:hypothetical protein L1887_22400 [Cichorium endivia]